MAYATAAAFKAYVIDFDPMDLSDDAIGRLLERASRDLDAYVLRWPAPFEDGPRVDLLSLTPYEAGALARATCSQAYSRWVRDETDLASNDDRVLTAGSITFAAEGPPIISPEALAELAGVGTHLVRRSPALPRPAEDAAPDD
jgi:hypothetical protein